MGLSMSTWTSTNPAFKDFTFAKPKDHVEIDGVMTIEGTIQKTAFLLICTLASTVWMWHQIFTTPNPRAPVLLALIAGLGAVVMVILTIRKPKRRTWAAQIYAPLEGLFIGAVWPRTNTGFREFQSQPSL